MDAITPGVKPQAYGHFAPRGGAKSSTAEMGVVRVGAVKLARRFGLYLCDTQEQADKHIQSIAALMEKIGVERSVNKYGSSRGWRRDQLRTANGFNLAGIGADSAARGAKLDQFRPDFIIVDDLDALHDTMQTVQKKKELLTATILAAGSPDCAVLFVQNPIHAGSLASQLSNRTADFLLGMVVDGPEPAVYNMEVEQDPETRQYSITGGEASWVGQPLETCQAQINEWGLQTFLRESQHDMRAGGAFFPEYDPALHLVPTPGIDDVDGKGKPIYPQSWWTWFAGLDGGYNDPAAFGLWCVSPSGQVACVEAWEAKHVLPAEQAKRGRETLRRWGVDPQRCWITYDHNMAASRYKGVAAPADVQAWTKAGLRMRPSDPSLDRQAHGWNRVREYLKQRLPGDFPKLAIYGSGAVIVADSLGAARYHLTKPEDMAHDGSSHTSHMVLYALAGQFGVSNAPLPPKPKPHPEDPFTDDSPDSEWLE
jgi:hypothetical protein